PWSVHQVFRSRLGPQPRWIDHRLSSRVCAGNVERCRTEWDRPDSGARIGNLVNKFKALDASAVANNVHRVRSPARPRRDIRGQTDYGYGLCTGSWWQSAAREAVGKCAIGKIDTPLGRSWGPDTAQDPPFGASGCAPEDRLAPFDDIYR